MVVAHSLRGNCTTPFAEHLPLANLRLLRNTPHESDPNEANSPAEVYDPSQQRDARKLYNRFGEEILDCSIDQHSATRTPLRDDSMTVSPEGDCPNEYDMPSLAKGSTTTSLREDEDGYYSSEGVFSQGKGVLATTVFETGRS